MNKFLKLFFKTKMFPNSDDWAMLTLRVIPSFYLFYYHGIGKLARGSSSWEWLGEAALSLIGIEFGYIIFGFFAALSEGVFSWLVILGLFTRIASIFIMVTMFFAGFYHLAQGDSPESAFIYFTIYLVVFILGSGKYSLEYLLSKKLRSEN